MQTVHVRKMRTNRMQRREGKFFFIERTIIRFLLILAQFCEHVRAKFYFNGPNHSIFFIKVLHFCKKIKMQFVLMQLNLS